MPCSARGARYAAGGESAPANGRGRMFRSPLEKNFAYALLSGQSGRMDHAATTHFRRQAQHIPGDAREGRPRLVWRFLRLKSAK